jgi:DNA gyrase subunit A
MLMSQGGALVRTPVKDISVVGRNTQGVRLIRLEQDDQLSGLERIEGLAAEDGTADEEPGTEPGTELGAAPGSGPRTDTPPPAAPDSEPPPSDS